MIVVIKRIKFTLNRRWFFDMWRNRTTKKYPFRQYVAFRLFGICVSIKSERILNKVGE